MTRYPKPREQPRVPTDHFKLLVKTAIAEGVQLYEDPIKCNWDDPTKYRIAVIREDNTMNFVWLPARTFNDPELLAGAIRPWRHDPVERAAFEAKLAEDRKALEQAKGAEPEGSTSASFNDREARRLGRGLR